ncbi:PH domain-containing protein DDB_G0274775-like [Antedon mediterranea]|uniref:PH domain-containing protein DDB_G0274775-like n=1 Tax=Antedon mediterranea TaxID=105859 RepID=UPI003AF7E4E4
MADEDQQHGSTSCSNSNAESRCSSNVDNLQKETDLENMKDGWLMKRTKMSQKWKKQWFSLRKSTLFYGDDVESATKSICLTGAEIAEADIDKKSFAFKVTPKGRKRTFFIHAENETDQQEWMQAICFAKAASHQGDASQACVVQ